MIIWNPWHGSLQAKRHKVPSGHKVSEGCEHCYMYFLDGKRGIDTSKVYRTENFNLPYAEHYSKAKENLNLN